LNPEINFEEGPPGVHLFQQARHLGHGKQAWGV
jgi:hypothetical protein